MILLRIAPRLPAYRHHHGKPDSSFLLFGFVRRSGVDKLQREQAGIARTHGQPGGNGSRLAERIASTVAA
jgi:hypothetical protein